jgi:hypothetical protein
LSFVALLYTVGADIALALLVVPLFATLCTIDPIRRVVSPIVAVVVAHLFALLF